MRCGGKIYDPVKRLVIRKKTIPPPRDFEFNSTASYEEVMGTLKPAFFRNGDDNLSHYSLVAGSSGVPFGEKLTVKAFLKERNTSPSKIRLYVVYKPQVY